MAADVRPLPRSLENIFAEYRTDLGFPAPSCGDLTPWAQRGVLLLNRVLTVRPGNRASHRAKGWEAVTECAIRALVDRRQPMVAILWGRDASTLKPMLAGSDCLSIESPHPHHCRRRGDLRLASVQSRERPAGSDGCRARRLATAVTS